MIITIILFIASIALIAFGIDMSTNPVSYHYGHGLFPYSIRYISTESIHTGAVLFSLGRALLISSFVMLGFTLYFSFSKKTESISATTSLPVMVASTSLSPIRRTLRRAFTTVAWRFSGG